MKLYTKTLLIIIILISFQAILTGVFVTRIISNNNVMDARLELQRESTLIANNFYSWKRHLWKQLMRINHYASDKNPTTIQEEDISTLLISTNVDAVVVRSEVGSFNIETISTSEDFILPDSDELKIYYEHPYMRLYLIQENLYLVGVTGVDYPEGSFSIFLIKHINDSFLKNIIFDTRGRVIFHTAGRILTGNFTDNQIVFREKLELKDNSYYEYYDQDHNNQSWNLAIQKCGTFGDNLNQEKVFITSVLSNEPFKKRIIDIEKTLVNVSLLIIIFTTLFSLIISRNITRPINRLLEAMVKIKEGSFKVQIQGRSQDEVGRLLSGFNEMALHLHQDQKKITESIQQITFLKEYNEQVFNSIRDSIAVVDGETIIEKTNNFFSSRFIGKSAHSLLKLEDLNSTAFDQTVIANITKVLGKELDFWSQRIRDHSLGVWELKVYPIDSEVPDGKNTRRCVLLLEDISQKVEYEEKIFQAEKLASLSMLSAGIAHEVNNPLSSIMTNIQNLIFDEQNSDRKELMELIENETRRIAEIIRGLLDFTSQEQDSRPEADLSLIIREVIKLISHSHSHSQNNRNGSNPEIILNIPEAIPPVIIGKGELMQILINLLQNALHATEGKGPVIITIEKKEKQIQFNITDRGAGIPASRLPRIFDPFYTTKSNREGTGLGLSVVYGIIKKYDGTITVSSSEGEGTEVICSLPAVSREE